MTFQSVRVAVSLIRSSNSYAPSDAARAVRATSRCLSTSRREMRTRWRCASAACACRRSQPRELPNAIVLMSKDGVGEPVSITKLLSLEWGGDRTKGHVQLTESPAAKAYHLWVSAHSDGSSAVDHTPGGLKQKRNSPGPTAGNSTVLLDHLHRCLRQDESRLQSGRTL